MISQGMFYPLYNGEGHTVTWQSSGVSPHVTTTLTTGVSSFQFHYGPVSAHLQTRAAIFGAQTAWEITCDYGLAIGPGDIIVITSLLGTVQSPPLFLLVQGVDQFASQLIPHLRLYLAKYQQK